MEKRYQGKWNINMRAEYCWGLIRECSVQILALRITSKTSLVNLKEGNFCNKIVFNPFIFSFVLSMCFCVHSFTLINAFQCAALKFKIVFSEKFDLLRQNQWQI